MTYTYSYPRPALTVDALVLNKVDTQWMLLLIQRKHDPFAGKWALPGGFMEMTETLLQACKRELKEETGLEGVELTQFYTFDALDRDPRHRTISTVFAAQLEGFAGRLRAEDDAAAVRWFSLDDLPELAFDHAEIIRRYVNEQRSVLS